MTIEKFYKKCRLEEVLLRVQIWQGDKIMTTEKGLTAAEYTELVKKLGGMEVAHGIINGSVAFKVAKVSFLITHTFTINVDETQVVENAVKMGKFDWSDNNFVSSKFPRSAKGNRSNKEIFLFDFGRNMSTKTVIIEIKKAGYKPAKILDLLGLAAKEPNIQRKSSIVALGAICTVEGHKNAPCLYGTSSTRGLRLDYLESDWPGDYLFAAVLK